LRGEFGTARSRECQAAKLSTIIEIWWHPSVKCIIGMTNLQQVAGIFRDRTQVKLAITAARRQGLDVPESNAVAEDAAGLHVVLRTTGAPEVARQLLLDYGAYSAVIS
jgi:hypothetical protein